MDYNIKHVCRELFKSRYTFLLGGSLNFYFTIFLFVLAFLSTVILPRLRTFATCLVARDEFPTSFMFTLSVHDISWFCVFVLIPLFPGDPESNVITAGLFFSFVTLPSISHPVMFFSSYLKEPRHCLTNFFNYYIYNCQCCSSISLFALPLDLSIGVKP